jgi:exodeoxyribonuclease VIII
MKDYKAIIGLNYSGAKHLLRSPAHFQASLVEEHKDTPALKFGRLVHTATFMPLEFKAKVAILPEGMDRRTKAGKETYEAFLAGLLPDTDVVDAETHAHIADVTESAQEGLSALGLDHVAWSVEEPMTKQYAGVTIKGRPDLVSKIGNEIVVVDLKTTQDASPYSFARDVHNFKYFMQAAWYLELTGATRFIFVAVEKDPPFAWRVYELDAEAIAEGKRLMDEACAMYKQCTTFNAWPSYSKDLTSLSLPRYAFSSPNNNQ